LAAGILRSLRNADVRWNSVTEAAQILTAQLANSIGPLAKARSLRGRPRSAVMAAVVQFSWPPAFRSCCPLTGSGSPQLGRRPSSRTESGPATESVGWKRSRRTFARSLRPASMARCTASSGGFASYRRDPLLGTCRERPWRSCPRSRVRTQDGLRTLVAEPRMPLVTTFSTRSSSKLKVGAPIWKPGTYGDSVHPNIWRVGKGVMDYLMKHWAGGYMVYTGPRQDVGPGH
jgi:hypothetical protein